MRHLCGALRTASEQRPTPHARLCSLLLLLRHLARAAQEKAQGSAAALRALCAVPGPDARQSHGAVAAADCIIAVLLREGPAAASVPEVSTCCEAVSALTACCSAPLHCPVSAGAPPAQSDGSVLSYVCGHRDAIRLCDVLVHFVVSADWSQPARGCVPFGEGSSLGAVMGAAAAAVLPTAVMDHVSASGPRQRQQLSAHLARRAALLLCVLAYHRKNLAATAPTRILVALRRQRDPQFEVASPAGCGALLAAFASPGALHHPEVVLLLHLLVTEDRAFCEALVARSDPEAVLVPLLTAALAAADHGGTELYVALSLFLALSQFAQLNDAIHQRVLRTVPWYTERDLHGVSAGSLLIIVLVRIVQLNNLSRRDPYVNRTAVSILSNLCPTVQGVHPYAAQRLVFLTAMLGKKALRLQAQERADLPQHAELLSDALSAIAVSLREANLSQNLHLVYELLHQRAGLEKLRKLPAAQKPLEEVCSVLNYFDGRLEVTVGDYTTVDNVMRVLREAAPDWVSRSTYAADYFAYAEEDEPEGFFVPYAWALIVHYYATAEAVPEWDPRRLPLFMSPPGLEPTGSCPALGKAAAPASPGQPAADASGL
eukprot:TRINITY_DN55718_c0_g1_i1.p1 TRINITY_DN55718_c0_g1~~TRINITY_DN55718_c0_g1_i1.p1  ORF type:complete len:698 (+),score=244.74 TRINITY_DN55718_c0_g1_i1:293-2095(+)